MSASPTLDEFLRMPLDRVRPLVPSTVILGAGGTRRRAVLAGISPQDDEYARWTRIQMVNCIDLILQHGVQHLITSVIVAGHEAEVTPGYREKLVQMTQAWIGGEALQDYARLGWRVRLFGLESWPALAPIAEKLLEATGDNPGPTVWYWVASNREKTWSHILRTAGEQGITDRQTLVRAVYGEDIPPATLYLGAGKPQVEDSLIPPLLVGKMECYWRQHLGYDLDERTLRTVLYDYLYVRSTWQADKTGRAEQIHNYVHAWADPPVVGLGRRLGPFWYPAPIAPVEDSVDDEQ